MAYLLATIPLLLVAADPLAGIVIGGSAGAAAALLGAALLGSALNAIRRRAAGHQPRFHAHGHTAADRGFCRAA
jgi:hypothetical protein